jgi:hypothetical protein
MTDAREGSPPAAADSARGPRGGGSLERVTVNLTPRSSKAMELACQVTEDTKTDVINKALQVYAYLAFLESGEGKVFTQEPGKKSARLKILLT